MNGIIRNPWIIIWMASVFIGIVIFGLLYLFSIQTAFPCFSNNFISWFFGQYIAVLGMLTAVSVALMSWIYNQGIHNRQKGFTDFRNATSDLNMNAVAMLQNLKRASSTNQVLLHQWAGATYDLRSEE